MVDAQEFERWRGEADRALELAQLATREGLYGWTCFAAEQAAQLAVKGLLHGLGRGPWGHDLVALTEMLRDAGIDVPQEVADRLAELSQFYIAPRYPDAHPSGGAGEHYTATQAARANELASGVLAWIDEQWELARAQGA